MDFVGIFVCVVVECIWFVSPWLDGEKGVLTLSVLDVELVDLLSELILLNGLSARNRKREASFKVLHLVHGADEQNLGE